MTARPPKATPGRRGAGPRAVRPPRCPGGDVVWAFLDAELPAARARAVAGHVARCARCHARARRLQAMLAACRTAGCQALPPGVRARARARARALIRAR